MQRRIANPIATRYAAAFALTFGLFALWGLGHKLYDVLLPEFAKIFGLSGYKEALAQNLYDFIYIGGAIPAALCARRFGYKTAILFGLGCFCVGAFLLYPATQERSTQYFLLAVCVMSCGWILLEIAANPLAASMGSIETSVRRINLAQALYPVGGLMGMLCAQWLISAKLAVPAKHLASSAVHPYIVIAASILVFAFLVAETRFPSLPTQGSIGVSAVRECRELLTRRSFLYAMVAQAFGIIALSACAFPGAYFIQKVYPQLGAIPASEVLMATFAVFGVGRLVGALLMYRIVPERLLTLFACAGILSSLIAASATGLVAVAGMLGANFFVSIVWPTVLGLGIRGLDSKMKIGTALLCISGAIGGTVFEIVGGGGMFPSTRIEMLVPALSFGMVLLFARFSKKRSIERVDVEVAHPERIA